MELFTLSTLDSEQMTMAADRSRGRGGIGDVLNFKDLSSKGEDEVQENKLRRRKIGNNFRGLRSLLV